MRRVFLTTLCRVDSHLGTCNGIWRFMGGCGEAMRDGTAQAGSSWVLTAEGPFDAEGDPPSPSPCDSCQSAAL